MTTLAITMYFLHGPALWCGPSVVETTVPWVAMPAAWYENGGECWDTVGIYADGEVRYFLALDRIAPGDWCVIQPSGECLPILVDVPEPHVWFTGLSTTGERFWNESRVQAMLRRDVWGWGEWR